MQFAEKSVGAEPGLGIRTSEFQKGFERLNPNPDVRICFAEGWFANLRIPKLFPNDRNQARDVAP
jgi:hypothetical protein